MVLTVEGFGQGTFANMAAEAFTVRNRGTIDWVEISGGLRPDADFLRITNRWWASFVFHRASQLARLVGNWRYEKASIDQRGLAWTKGRNGSRQSSLRQVL
jgi:hypothetical protein